MEISNSELRERLIDLGYNPPPITSTSRNILLKKLKSLETGSTMESIINSDESEESMDEKIVSTFVTDTEDSTARHRLHKYNFFPENVGMYSRCYVKNTDFWDRIGTFGTFFLLISVTIAVCLLLKFIGDWNDRRYRNVDLNDGVYPKCNEGGHLGITCIPDSEFKHTESNLNVIRSLLHHATITDRCIGKSSKNNEFIGFYPLFKDDVIENWLIKELRFSEIESKTLLRNAKVLFKMNPQFEIKVLNDGLMYRNPRLLRSCGYVSQNTVIYTYALYFFLSFVGTWFVYKSSRWVQKLRSDNNEERRRLIKDISDILKQKEKVCGLTWVDVKEMREWLSSAINLRGKLWDDVINYLKQHEASISLQKKILRGEECDVFCLKK